MECFLEPSEFMQSIAANLQCYDWLIDDRIPTLNPHIYKHSIPITLKTNGNKFDEEFDVLLVPHAFVAGKVLATVIRGEFRHPHIQEYPEIIENSPFPNMHDAIYNLPSQKVTRLISDLRSGEKVMFSWYADGSLVTHRRTRRPGNRLLVKLCAYEPPESTGAIPHKIKRKVEIMLSRTCWFCEQDGRNCKCPASVNGSNGAASTTVTANNVNIPNGSNEKSPSKNNNNNNNNNNDNIWRMVTDERNQLVQDLGFQSGLPVLSPKMFGVNFENTSSPNIQLSKFSTDIISPKRSESDELRDNIQLLNFGLRNYNSTFNAHMKGKAKFTFETLVQSGQKKANLMNQVVWTFVKSSPYSFLNTQSTFLSSSIHEASTSSEIEHSLDSPSPKRFKTNHLPYSSFHRQPVLIRDTPASSTYAASSVHNSTSQNYAWNSSERKSRRTTSTHREAVSDLTSFCIISDDMPVSSNSRENGHES